MTSLTTWSAARARFVSYYIPPHLQEAPAVQTTAEKLDAMPATRLTRTLIGGVGGSAIAGYAAWVLDGDASANVGLVTAATVIGGAVGALLGRHSAVMQEADLRLQLHSEVVLAAEQILGPTN